MYDIHSETANPIIIVKLNIFLITAATLASTSVLTSTASTQTQWDTYPDTWVAVDELGRTVATADNGVDRHEPDEEACVGMFYYIWHGYHNECGKDVTELLKENPDNPDWGPANSFHWGSKPWLGYYQAGDSYVMARHMQMLCDAGIDFLFVDMTNGYYYPYQVTKLFAELNRREALGMKTPKIAFTLHSRAAQTIEKIYSVFYKDKDTRHWFYYDGKPLILADRNELAGNVSDEILDFFTFRNSWAWMEGRNPDEWSWLEFYPQAPGWTRGENDGQKIEQISVSVAQHAHSKIGKSYHNGSQPAIDPQGLCKETPYGLYFQEQWDRAIEVHAPIVMVTQFNEWIAQRFVISNEVEMNYLRPGATTPSIGETYFIDVYNAEFDRDIEPSTHPLIRDNYYLQLVSNVRKYRGARQIPVPTVNLTIDIDKDFSQWDAESVVYRDDKNDTEYTSKDVQTPATLSRATNDLIEAKVTQDAANIYFYISTSEPISDREKSDRWMRLFLNTDTDYTTGWYGYDYSVYTDRATGKYSLMKHTADFNWETVAPVKYRAEGERMHLAIPKNLLGTDGYRDIDFKWADNVSDDNPDIMTFISDGDVAPNGRFNYRYKGASLTSGIAEVADGAGDMHLAIRHDGERTTISCREGTGLSVRIYNATGAECFSGKSDRNGSISCTLPSGVYIVRYTAGGKSGSQKFMRP